MIFTMVLRYIYVYIYIYIYVSAAQGKSECIFTLLLLPLHKYACHKFERPNSRCSLAYYLHSRGTM
jgi:hypothetical protein